MLTTSTELISTQVLGALEKCANDVGLERFPDDFIVSAIPRFHRPWQIDISLYFKPLDFRQRFSIDCPDGNNASKNAACIHDQIVSFLAKIKEDSNGNAVHV